MFNRLLESLNCDLEFDKRLPWLDKQSLDIYSQKYNFAIEYNGIQHYEPISFFGGEKYFKYIQELDNKKIQLCNKNNCKIWIVKYNYSELEYLNLVDQIKEYMNEKQC